VLSDPLTLPQAMAIEAGLKKNADTAAEGNNVEWTRLDDGAVKAILVCVEKWELENFPEIVTAENFPASPRLDSHKLIDWLFGEIIKIYTGDAQIPNE
jgi:hypothetical protein